MTSAVFYARLSNRSSAVAAVLARVGLEDRARWWRQEARRQRTHSRQIATADHVDRLLCRAEKEAA
jgi:hypothetical protein